MGYLLAAWARICRYRFRRWKVGSRTLHASGGPAGLRIEVERADGLLRVTIAWPVFARYGGRSYLEVRRLVYGDAHKSWALVVSIDALRGGRKRADGHHLIAQEGEALADR